MEASSKFDSFLADNRVLLLMLFVVLLLGIIFYMAGTRTDLRIHARELALVAEIKSAGVQQRDIDAAGVRLQLELEAINQQSYRAGMLHHLSLAFFISFITIIAVEFHTRKLMRKDLQTHLEEVKQNVWQALGKRLLGEQIATELEAIMKEDAAKEDSSYVITFCPPCDGVPNDRVIVRVENAYKLRNLTGVAGRTHQIRTSISNYERIGVFPRFTEFKVDNRDCLADSVQEDQPGAVRKQVGLPETDDGRISVVLGMEIAYKLRDAETFVTEIPVEGLHVIIVNQTPDRITGPTLDKFGDCGKGDCRNLALQPRITPRAGIHPQLGPSGAELEHR